MRWRRPPSPTEDQHSTVPVRYEFSDMAKGAEKENLFPSPLSQSLSPSPRLVFVNKVSIAPLPPPSFGVDGVERARRRLPKSLLLHPRTKFVSLYIYKKRNMENNKHNATRMKKK